MASLILGAAGSVLGADIFGSGITVLGATISGAQIGGALGAIAGTVIDQALTNQSTRRTGPRISDVNVQASTEGAPIPRLFGRVRVAGQLIWASQFQETAATTHSGGKGGGSAAVTETDYTYSISFAVGLCAGKATRLGRIWVGGALMDQTGVTLRFHDGSEDQAADPLIAEIEGAANAPAFRGLCYVVFEDLQLAAYGNRIPQLQFEVIRSIGHDNPASLENRLTGVQLIPGAGEFVYDTQAVFADDGYGGSTPQNVHTAGAVADIMASLDDLTAAAPNLASVSLVVGWFGDDLRAGQGRVRPGVEALDKTTYPESWSVNGVARADAHLVSQRDGRPAYGGTPSDASVVAALAALTARGLRVLFNPFVFMDIVPGNALADPYGGASQPAHPWRGRITCDPAPGVAGSPDTTAAAAADVAAFFGGAAVSDFTVSGTDVTWNGGDDWGWRRMVLHYAHLCAAAGGVEAFLIGSELRGLTQVRDGATRYPAVAALKALAADVRSILPGAKIGYGADWSEYNNHNLGGGAVLFHLDPLWSDANIDFIGIDNYLPLSDWRDGAAHLDAREYDSITDPAYLTANIRGGEDYDWYYLDNVARDVQSRTPITDGLGKPWVWRPKDLWGWWSNAHYDRPGGSESVTATAWAPQSKPIWFTELGCPAIDKGANQPNVFFDAKSSESATPYYSSGARDDLMQRRFLEAQLNFWVDAANNPVSSVYGGAMVGGIHAWCWDARPFPQFPALSDVWGDAGNYQTGHWLNGRLGAVALADLVGALCNDAGFSAYDTSGLDGIVTGFAVTDTMSARDAITPLATAFFFDAVESQGVLRFVMRGRGDPASVTTDDLVLPSGDPTPGFQFVRAQEEDLPQVSRIGFIDGDADYRQASVEARRLTGASNRVATSSLPLVMDQGTATGIGARLLQDAWMMRESAGFTLPPSWLARDAGDQLLLTAGGRDHQLRLTQVDDTASRAIQAVATDPSVYDVIAGPAGTQRTGAVATPGRALLFLLDLPWLTDGQNVNAPFVGAYADPWPGNIAVLRSASDSGFAPDVTLTQACRFGITTQDFYGGPRWHWDRANSLCIKMINGTLASADAAGVYGGANVLAIENADGGWEIVQFATATLTAPGQYTLTNLLRGRRGSESQMRAPVAAGARAVVLDTALQQLSFTTGQARQDFHYQWGPVSRPATDVSWQTTEAAMSAAALMPLAPCHVGFTRNGADLVITWRRRDRAPSAASLAPAQTAMSETREAYDLEICNGGAVVRTYSNIAQHSQIYSASDQAADFPSGLPGLLVVNVYQLSSIIGRGRPATESLYVG